MKKIIRAFLVLMVLVLVLSACTGCQQIKDMINNLIRPNPPVLECTHTGGNATCTEKAICTECGEAYGEALGHNFAEGACTVCGEADPDYVAPHEHNFVDGKCECGEEDPNYVPPHVNTLVIGDNKIIVSGETLNTAGAPIEWVEFVVEEKAHYEFTGNTYAFVYVRKDLADFSACVCGFSGKADLEPGTYYICIGGVNSGEFTITVTKSEIAAPHEHVWADATCTAPQTCECGETQGEALGHDLADVAEKAATCTEDGYNAHKACSRCDYTQGKEVVKAAHTLKYTVVLPTATTPGHTTVVCEACSDYSVVYGDVSVMTEGTYVIDPNAEGLAGTASGTYKDGQVYVHGGVFEMHMSAKFRVDGSNKATINGTVLQGRLNWGGKTQFPENGGIINGIVFTTADETTVRIYWVQGGDDHRQVALYNLAGEIVAQSDNQTAAKNDPCYSELTVPAGTYVLGNVINTNYFFKVEVEVGKKEEHVHEFVYGECECGEKDPNYVPPVDDGNHSFDATVDVVAGADKEIIPNGTRFDDGFFKVTGDVTQRVKEGAVYAVEVGKNASGAIEFTLTVKSTVSVVFSSTGNSNTSLVGIIDANGNLVANNEGITEVTGANDGKTTLTYTLEPGTYSVVSPKETTTAYKRGARVYSITTAPASEEAPHEHSWTDVAGKDATCTEDGYTAHKVCECGEKQGYEVVAAGHKLVDVAGKDATCTEAGYSAHKACSNCDYVEGKEVVAAGHKLVDVAGKDATCTEDGYTAHKACSNCDHVEGKEVVAAAGHIDADPRDHECDVCGLCTSDCADANKNHKCDICDDVMSKCADNDKNHFCDYCGVQNSHCIDIPPYDHNCDWCGEKMSEHNYVDGVCDVCGAAAPHEHSWSDATCTEPKKCACGATDGEALGHRIENAPGKAATCTEAGYTAYQECTREGCDYVGLNSQIPALGHDLVDVAGKDATCSVAGYTAYKACSRCDHIEGKGVVPATGEHADIDDDYKCDACSTKMLPADGSTLTIEQAITIAKMQAHNTYTTQKYYITGVVTNVYNTTYGNFYIKDAEGNELCIYGLYKDSVRYDAMTYKPVEGDEVTVYGPLGAYNTTYQMKNAELDDVVAHEHDYKSDVTEAGCLTEGYTTHTCTICANSYTDSNVEALGHTTDNGVCERCGSEITGDAPVFGTLATFEFGANGAAGHSDGNDYGTSKTFTEGSYSLKLTGMSKVFGPAKDEKGNSCIKLGTSKVVGTFTFTVPENVTEVVIYVAKYKSSSTKIAINGTNYTLTKNSNDGAYDMIVIDTTTTKTITFATVASTYRCMINTIVFNGYAE